MADVPRHEEGPEPGDQLDELVDDLPVSETDAESVLGGASVHEASPPTAPLPPPLPYPNVVK
jgi:hypothetical protein